MSVSAYQIFKCRNPQCGLRFPQLETSSLTVNCPRCGEPAGLVRVIPRRGDQPHTTPANVRLEAFLDNIRSAWNVGSMIRSADSAGIRQIYLAGITATPKNDKVCKTSLGAERNLLWEYHPDAIVAAEKLLAVGRSLWALESNLAAESIWDVSPTGESELPVLVVGNENCGVDPGLLARCQRTLCIPMRGVKSSLNAAVAFGIAVHWLGRSLRSDPAARGGEN